MSAGNYDVLALGIAAVDDLLHVAAYPAANGKVPVARSARHAGGLACTAAAAAASLGGSCAFAARLGEDELSAFIKKRLAERGVDISRVVHDPEAGPFHSTIIVDDTGERTIFFASEKYRPLAAMDVAEAAITQARIVLLDYLVDPPATSLAEKIRSLGVPILGDIEGRSASCLALLPLIDMLIVSEEFARWSAGTDDLSSACAFLAKTPRRMTVVTAGSQGCYLATAEAPVPQHVPAFPVEVHDTNGCGDTFHGAFALALARGLSARDAVTFASGAAAMKACGSGGWNSLPTAGELLEFISQRVAAPQRSPRLMTCLQELAKSA